MEEFPSTTTNESTPNEDKESSSSTKKKDTSVRKIGAFAKITAEAPAVPADRAEARKSFFENKSEITSTEEVEKTLAEKDTRALKNELLQKHLDAKIEAHQEVIGSSMPGSPEHSQALSAKEFDQSIQEKANDPEVEHDSLIEKEYAKLLGEMKAPDESDEALVEEADGTTDENEYGPSEDYEESTIALPISRSTPTTNIPMGPSSPRQKSPTPPVIPPQKTTPLPPALPPLPSMYNQPPDTIKTPSPMNPNHLSGIPPETGPNAHRDTLSKNERSKKTGAFITGGILGYMVGRHRGRKRAERRLEPEIKQRTTELEATKQRLESRELQIKKAAENTVRAKRAEATRQTAEKAPQIAPKPATEILRQTIMAPEAIRSAITKPVTEQLSTESRPSPQRAEQRLATPIVEAVNLNKRAEQLSTPALLKAAESLVIEGVSVRRMYETNKIDRVGLVKIVQEGLSGGNIVHAFEKVELGAEAQAGRAREFRHDDPSFSAISTDDVTLGPPVPASKTLPNNPDATSLQPIHLPTETENKPVKHTEALQEQKTKHAPKTAEFAFAAIAAIAIAVLIIWAII